VRFHSNFKEFFYYLIIFLYSSSSKMVVMFIEMWNMWCFLMNRKIKIEIKI